MGTGCGTIMGKRYSTVRIKATPAADYIVVNANNEKIGEGRTPGKIKLKATDSETHIAAKYYVVFNAPGKATQVTVVDSGQTKWLFGNCLFGVLGILPGFICIGIDCQAGATFFQKDVQVQMTQAQFPNQVSPDLTSQ